MDPKQSAVKGLHCKFMQIVSLDKFNPLFSFFNAVPADSLVYNKALS